MVIVKPAREPISIESYATYTQEQLRLEERSLDAELRRILSHCIDEKSELGSFENFLDEINKFLKKEQSTEYCYQQLCDLERDMLDKNCNEIFELFLSTLKEQHQDILLAKQHLKANVEEEKAPHIELPSIQDFSDNYHTDGPINNNEHVKRVFKDQDYIKSFIATLGGDEALCFEFLSRILND